MSLQDYATPTAFTPQRLHGRVLIVAGSDSGGGAGIQADIKTVSALGGFAMTAITALTAQNTLGIHGIYPIPPAFIAQQIRVVCDDLGVDVIKIGMLHSAEVIRAVAAALPTEVPLVLDPVMVAKGGASLLEASAKAALIAELLPRATVITPNLPEAAALVDFPMTDDASRARAIQQLLRLGPAAVLLKGGHRPTALADGTRVVIDQLWQPNAMAPHTWQRPWLDSRHTHGTGCTLASAMATGLAQGLDLVAATTRAGEFVAQALKSAPGFGQGHGPLNHHLRENH